jgi:hypothetical protein
MIPYLLILLTTLPSSLYSSSSYHDQTSRRHNSRDIYHAGPSTRSQVSTDSHGIRLQNKPPDNPLRKLKKVKTFKIKSLNKQLGLNKINEDIPKYTPPTENSIDRAQPTKAAKFFSANADGLPSGMQVGELSLGDNRLLYTYVNATGLSAAAGVMVAGFIIVGGALYAFNSLTGEDSEAGYSLNGFNFNKSDKIPSNEVEYWGDNWNDFNVVRKKR